MATATCPGCLERDARIAAPEAVANRTIGRLDRSTDPQVPGWLPATAPGGWHNELSGFAGRGVSKRKESAGVGMIQDPVARHRTEGLRVSVTSIEVANRIGWRPGRLRCRWSKLTE